VSDGLLVVDKPAGWTSHDVVGRCRRLAGTKKVGHAGTLDPMATGVLVLGVGRATRLLGHLRLTDKAYDATVRLGATTVTDDAEGEVVERRDASTVTDEALARRWPRSPGESRRCRRGVGGQGRRGVRSYARVRAGRASSWPARRVVVSRLERAGPARATTSTSHRGLLRHVRPRARPRRRRGPRRRRPPHRAAAHPRRPVRARPRAAAGGAHADEVVDAAVVRLDDAVAAAFPAAALTPMRPSSCRTAGG
jgi:tRNA pseudouridine(55) synthase